MSLSVHRAISRAGPLHIAIYLFFPMMQGDILLVAEKFDDGWVRGIRMNDLEVI